MKRISAFDKIEQYILSNWNTIIQFIVLSQNVSEYDPNENLITLSFSKKKNDPIVLATLLHEIGHMMIIKENTWSKLTIHFSSMANPFYKCKSKMRFVDIIREEVLAWEVGWEVAKELKLDKSTIPWNKYHRIMKKSLWTYLKGITSIKGWNK